MTSKTTSRHDSDHKGHQSSQIRSKGDGERKLPSRSLTFEVASKVESMETYQSQNLMTPQPPPVEHIQPSDLRRPSTTATDDEHDLTSNQVCENMSTKVVYVLSFRGISRKKSPI